MIFCSVISSHNFGGVHMIISTKLPKEKKFYNFNCEKFSPLPNEFRFINYLQYCGWENYFIEYIYKFQKKT